MSAKYPAPINYTLMWPHLESPSNSTFTLHQLDMCNCPQQKQSHIYTRYVCQGPDVQYARKENDLWLLCEPWGQFNILRPASREELRRRPSASIVRVNRYQAYATQKWLSRLSHLAQTNITNLSLICDVFEEDCRDLDALRSYASFSRFILGNLPRCRTLHTIHWNPSLPLRPLCMLFQREGMQILVKQEVTDDKYKFELCDAWTFYTYTGAYGHEDNPAGKRLYHRFHREKLDPEQILGDSKEMMKW
ncbi:hypothetical protein CC78DRAFT_270936 [Lojkania enalia]|uniref:Uncharacterized protein n=1 Tax=Lojkania enalia TaxID=147567 RepID=A0A9P4N2L6_9PLEO|nr:hypothetical protein CC78DRAFT_270936 [Didymosphaeria enalia]